LITHGGGKTLPSDYLERFAYRWLATLFRQPLVAWEYSMALPCSNDPFSLQQP
jgi:hypothetical protein